MVGIAAPIAADRAAVIAMIETVPLRIPLQAGHDDAGQRAR